MLAYIPAPWILWVYHRVSEHWGTSVHHGSPKNDARSTPAALALPSVTSWRWQRWMWQRWHPEKSPYNSRLAWQFTNDRYWKCYMHIYIYIHRYIKKLGIFMQWQWLSIRYAEILIWFYGSVRVPSSHLMFALGWRPAWEVSRAPGAGGSSLRGWKSLTWEFHQEKLKTYTDIHI